jgi:2-keto-4-pentenoate hydratase/2-oxohepta-3-ene-1,7-dioic acid hydratase in catechol pathway
MKLASYIADGKACFGVVAGDGVITLNQRLGGRYTSLRDALAADALAEIGKGGAKADHGLSDIKWLPAIPNPEKILCAGINYRSHAAGARCPNSRACSFGSRARSPATRAR